uniref:non-specific serine/threonine protein kinase n=1 Tax=viral metagenome TaxID=1070528 RepID=A0A6C0KFR3_9ZZZZ
MNKYFIIKTLGKGSFGSVLKVKYNENYYAMKKIMLFKNNYNKIITEISILNYSKCRYINKLFDFFIEDNYIYIITNLCNQYDLYQYILYHKKNNIIIAEKQIWIFFIQICYGIRYLHNNNIIHRDLKTANIFIHNNNIQIGDFGISKKLHLTNDFTKTVIGTPYYLSPELINNIQYNKKVDIWALGCILYEMIFLTHAFGYNNLKDVIVMINEAKYIKKYITLNYSIEIYNIIDLLICKHPKDRLSIYEIINNITNRLYLVDSYDQNLIDKNIKIIKNLPIRTLKQFKYSLRNIKIIPNLFYEEYYLYKKLPPIKS